MRIAPAWEIAARLEDAAKAILLASKALDAAYSAALSGNQEAARDMDAVPGAGEVNGDMAKALQALSDKYQAIADAEIIP